MPFVARLTVTLRTPEGREETVERSFYSPGRWQESSRAAIDVAREMARERGATLLRCHLHQVGGVPGEVA